MPKAVFSLSIMCLLLASCHRNWHYIPLTYDQSNIPEAPSYADDSSWASLPSIHDSADTVPGEQFRDQQSIAKIDVFYLHPTTFFTKDKRWNAPLKDQALNEFTDEAPIRHQASIFNGSCKVYAPRYRQAHLKSYLHLQEGGVQALDLAYLDVKSAFEYYLLNFNNNRPFILAGHSQGATHLIRLMKEMIDGFDIQDRLVAAYLVGMPVQKDEFKNIPPCLEEGDIGCFMSWMTFGKGFVPDFYEDSYKSNLVTNPITFSSADSTYNDYKLHKGILTKNFTLKYVNSISAKPEEGMLYIKRPNVPILKWFISNRVWHKADMNLFWVNVRENVGLRTREYLDQNSSAER